MLFGYLMVNDLFNVEAAETTVVLRKLLQCHVLRLTVGGGGGGQRCCHNVLTSAL